MMMATPTGRSEPLGNWLWSHDLRIPGQADQEHQADWRADPADDAGRLKHADHRDAYQGQHDRKPDGSGQDRVEAAGAADALGQTVPPVELRAHDVGSRRH